MTVFSSGTDHDPLILLPNRVILGVVNALCPCGTSSPVRDGILRAHFPVMHQDRRPTLTDPFDPFGACRNSDLAVTQEAALERDEALTDAERRVRCHVLNNPSMWLGLLDWVTFGDVVVGDRVGFTQSEHPDPFESRAVVERSGTVKRRGKTFVVITADEDGYADKVRLTAKTWGRARVRKISFIDS